MKANIKYVVLWIFVSLLMLLFPGILLGDLELWKESLVFKQPDGALYMVLSLLVGSYAAVYFYIRKRKRCNYSTAAKTGLLAALLGACPACIPTLAFFLPLSISVALGAYSLVFSAVGIALVLYALHSSGVFAWKKRCGVFSGLFQTPQE